MRSALAALLAGALLAGCRQDMHDQPRYDPLEKSAFFPDGRTARPRIEGTVARGELTEDEHLHFGTVDGAPAETYPFELTAEVLERGRERYDIFCSPCHDRVGAGNGMIVQRGLKRPSSFHVDRLRSSPPGYFFDVITNGFGVMYDYSDRIPARDRWAIAAYIEALQLSQNATLEDVPESERLSLQAEVQ